MTGSAYKPLAVGCLLLGLLLSAPVRAAHIIGGDITYVCNNPGSYTFTMKMYRDCNGGGAPFDSGPGAPLPGTITVYRGNSLVPFLTRNLGAPVITPVLPNLSNPCLIAPPNVCVQQAIYTFSLDLPVSTTQSYHIVYQRCCRNNTITNIIGPGETGATYWVEITPKAQQLCNSSPVFDNFPPIVICAGEPVDFDHAATDPDGDQLSYELFTPFTGGGNDEQNPTAPDGVAPDPDMPPPFNTVNFLGPLYGFDNPLGGPQPLTIDANTGFLTGIPALTGQFVVGVLVREYRDNELLSVVRRDFQFNVATCDPTVVADIREDAIVTEQGDQFYVVDACGLDPVLFANQSFQQAFINEYRWEFAIDGGIDTFPEWSPAVPFPGTGTYYGALYLNPGTNCGDTALIKVNVYPELTADFSYAYDTCVAGPVSFQDLSVADAGPGSIVSWEWELGDGQTATEPDPSHLYGIPGELPVTLLVQDSNGCEASRQRTLRYFPVPPYLLLGPGIFTACQPAEVFFDNLSSPVDEQYDITWTFGDGNTATAVSPTHTFEDVGVFDVSLRIVSPLGCAIDTVWPQLVTVLPSPVAGFTYNPEILSNLAPTARFTDLSQDAFQWKWTFGNSGISIEQNPVHTFPDTGLQLVRQVVFHRSGCTDTALALLDVIPEVRYFLPNAFTPNGDGINDGFLGKGSLEGATDFRLTIWNRYGERLFETTDPSQAWNGRKDNIGELAPQGVYVAVATFKGPRGEPFEIRGYATLVK